MVNFASITQIGFEDGDCIFMGRIIDFCIYALYST